MALTMQLFILVLLPAAFLLPRAARAGEIIGGQEVRPPHSRPYMAFLRIEEGGEFYRCGGVLVSENFVLTAAHCDGSKITVYLGAHNVRQREPSWQVISAARHFPHPQYNNTPDNNDVMLLQLSENARLTKAVSTIKLPPAPHALLPGSVCSTAGWGLISLTDTTDTLREVNLTVMSDQTCGILYSDYNASTMLCAGDPCYNKIVYLGDSGGPLVCGGVAEGIVSYGNSDATPPSVFTRISYFLPWINDILTHF